MRKQFLGMAGLMIFLSMMVVPVLGVETSYDSTDPVLVPGHPLYFMKQAYEGLRYTFTFGAENKYNYQQELIQERNREMAVLQQKGDTQNMEKLQNKITEQNIVMMNLRTAIQSQSCQSGCGGNP